MYNEYYEMGIYKIKKDCIESHPCQHQVINLISQEEVLLSGDTIYKLLKDNGLYIDHFEIYDFYEQEVDLWG